MTNKPTDAEIIKALDCCAIDYCNDCPLANEDIEEIGCDVNIHFVALDLIGRLKAENEELNNIIFTDRSEAIKLLKTEAIKEFVERLKGLLSLNVRVSNEDYLDISIDIDNLVKEMVGDNE